MLTDALFQALFDTPSPRLLLSADGPDFKIVCDNQAFKLASYNTVITYTGKSIWDVFNTENVGRNNLIRLRNILTQQAGSNQKSYLHDFKYQAPGNGKLEDYWELEIMPVGTQEDQFRYILFTIKARKNKKSVGIQRYEELSDVISPIPAGSVLAGEVTENILGLQREQQLIEELKAMNEDLAAFNTELAENESRFRFLLNALPQQVWTASSAGLLDYVNQVVCDDFGFDNETVIGHGWRKFVHPDDLEESLERWANALETRCEYVTEFRLLFGDGNYKWFLARAIPLIENDKILLWIGTNTNIDLQKNNEQRKDEFISIASHELKTPLTSIKAFNQLIQRKNSEQSLDGFILKSAQNITRLERLIKDLLDVTKINAGKIIYEMEPFDFKEMLTESIACVQLTAPGHEIILENAVDITYLGDQYRMEQVVHNFLTNAVKYSPNGKRVIVRSAIEENNIIVSFQDFGIGIAETDRKRLFERYYRVADNIMRFEGLGLGLFISSEILRRHKGDFRIESEPGKGSTFYFRLPVS